MDKGQGHVQEEVGEQGQGQAQEQPQEQEPEQVPAQESAEAKKRSYNKRVGKRGEESALRYLESVNYTILEKNWRCPAGEVDIIAKDGDCVVFIEVKTRSSIDKGFPEDAVTPQKRGKLERVAAFYLAHYPQVDMAVRFDVIALLIVGPDRALVKHHVNAFGVA